MQYISRYHSPMGGILLAGDGNGLTGLWFEGQKYFAYGLGSEYEAREVPVFEETRRWLTAYFSGRKPQNQVPLHFLGTDFQKEVWKILCTIPYGRTITYGKIAARIAAERGISHMSAQAVGGAVGHNKISVLVPCHRIIGTNGSLTGYAGGIDRKVKLLELEGADMKSFVIPEKGAALQGKQIEVRKGE